jgi:hypothetical protein
MPRNRAIVAAATLLLAFGAIVLGARSSMPTQVAGGSIDVLQMMKDARDLPTQQFDAI